MLRVVFLMRHGLARRSLDRTHVRHYISAVEIVGEVESNRLNLQTHCGFRVVVVIAKKARLAHAAREKSGEIPIRRGQKKPKEKPLFPPAGLVLRRLDRSSSIS